MRAAAPGLVVYAGAGLRGYGKLVIIKHSEILLSAYAHNDQIMVKEGQSVKADGDYFSLGSDLMVRCISKYVETGIRLILRDVFEVKVWRSRAHR